MNSSARDRWLGLLIVTGFMLLVTALPLGAVLGLQDHYTFHSGWQSAMTLGVVMAVATAIVGGVFLYTGECIVKRRNRQFTTTHDDAA